MNHNAYINRHVFHLNNEEDDREEYQLHHGQVEHHVPSHQHEYHLHDDDL